MSKAVNMRNLYYEKMELTNLIAYFGSMTSEQALEKALAEESKVADMLKYHPNWNIAPGVKKIQNLAEEYLKYAGLLEKEENEKKSIIV